MTSSIPTQKATLAGGCFWCLQPTFNETSGVLDTTVGYTGGVRPNPTYEQVVTGATGHSESIQVTFDPKSISFEEILEIFWRNINPTQGNGQFFDIGTPYQTAIFFHDEAQEKAAIGSREALEASGTFSDPITTKILPAKEFYPAEEYHQNYYQKKAAHYQAYKTGSGREGFLKQIWGKKK